MSVRQDHDPVAHAVNVAGVECVQVFRERVGGIVGTCLITLLEVVGT